MMTERPSHLIDPICGMTVEVARSEAAGLLFEHDGRTYAFCGNRCRGAFVEDPAKHVDATEASLASQAHEDASPPVIDQGMRRWYESCPCCLSEAFPDIKAQLDAERASSLQPPVEAGICEVAEAASGA